jgi:pantothenate synthetase
MSLTDLATRKQEVNKVLEETRELEFDEVIIIGIRGREVSLKHSRIDDTLLILGALEYAKVRLVRNMAVYTETRK